MEEKLASKGKSSGSKRGRPTKRNDDVLEAIFKEIENGLSKGSAAQVHDVPASTFNSWINADPKLAARLDRAEAAAERRNVLVLQRAAAGYDLKRVKRTSKTVIRFRKTTHPDGRIVEEPVALQEINEEVIESREFDWRAALEWLARRRSTDWGRASKVELTGPDGKPIQHQSVGFDLTNVSKEDLETVEKILSKAVSPDA